MLAYLAAANAGYATIKKFVVNERGTITKMNGLFSKVMGKAADDFDEFLMLEQMTEKRKGLESICRLTRHPALGINLSPTKPRCGNSANVKLRNDSVRSYKLCGTFHGV